MKYRTKPIEVLAWRFEVDKPIPVWVAAKCHKLGSSAVLTCNTQAGLMDAKPGDWITKWPEADGAMAVLTDEEFHALFEAAPDANKERK